MLEEPTKDSGSNQRSARAGATVILRAGGTTEGAVTKNQMPELLGRSWKHVGGDLVTLKTSIKAGGARKKYPFF